MEFEFLENIRQATKFTDIISFSIKEHIVIFSKIDTVTATSASTY